MIATRTRWVLFFTLIVLVCNVSASAQEGNPDQASGVSAPATDGVDSSSADPSAPAANGIAQLLFGNPLVFISVAMLSFYLIVLRPQQRALKKSQLDHALAIKNLKKNDRVVTSSGIHGTVAGNNVEAKTVVIRLDENARMTVNADTIAVINPDKDAKSD